MQKKGEEDTENKSKPKREEKKLDKYMNT